jgi:LmbE family N-acetylglucosaminyl deacetylase
VSSSATNGQRKPGFADGPVVSQTRYDAKGVRERTALVIHAHPDDEVFATGAATIALAEAGWRVVLRTATAGEAGEDAADLSAAALRRARRLDASCELLGITEWDWLADPGRWIDDGGAAGPLSLAASDAGETAGEIARTLRSVKPDLVLGVGADGLTGHPDHVAIADALRIALLQSADCRCAALGARLDTLDVEAGHRLLQRVLPGESVGSGRVVGCPNGTPLTEIAGSVSASLRRRQALDQYAAGLGTQDLRQLVSNYRRRGDSLLLRAVLDVSGWHRDRFESLRAPAAPADWIGP